MAEVFKSYSKPELCSFLSCLSRVCGGYILKVLVIIIIMLEMMVWLLRIMTGMAMSMMMMIMV